MWIGCGASINFVDTKTLEVKVTFHFCSNLHEKVGLSNLQGSTIIPDGVLDKIVVSGSVAIASALNGSTLFMYNVESTKLVMSFSLSLLASMVDSEWGGGESGRVRRRESYIKILPVLCVFYCGLCNIATNNK